MEERLALLLRPGPRRVRPDTSNGSDQAPPPTRTQGERHSAWSAPAELGGSGEELRDIDDTVDSDFARTRTGSAMDSPSDPASAPQSAASATGADRRSGRATLRWRFGRPQLLVIVAVVAVGVLLGGWAVLRARPIAIASPPPSTTEAATPSAPASAPASAHDPPVPSPTAAAAHSATPKIKIHVLGAVQHPGVVALAEGARVQDALRAAGGVKRSAELGDLNLAQRLTDGQQLFVSHDPDRTELRDPGVSSGSGGVTDSSGGDLAGESGASPAGSGGAKINLNTATVTQLDQLPGIGPVTAQKIISWREQHQRFNSVQELQEVDGIGPKTFADLEPLVTAP
ncbi:ComEA family DNA-binding protein [Microlunatus elymi]|uniref:ComEA family DNA-binding protein n=1 Tax=Microlunatus elymi TaxID=2596828 RepID=A0A516PY71_9ACTN|nr:ComEA family DNA-binding protein [Microlunatus elymi]QDP96117.1 ComEA family DNA-binding protein [Microlunatus elymi]